MVRRERRSGSNASRALLLVLWLSAGVGGGCTTNHDALALQPKGGGATVGGAGGSGLAGGGFGNTGQQPSQGGRLNPDSEASGDNVLTIVNGVVDAPSVRLCFARVGASGDASELVGAPLPELAYAASTVLTELPGLSLSDDVIEAWVIAGELGRLKNLDCQAAVALAQSEEAKVAPDGAGGQGGAGDALGAAGAPLGQLEMPTLRARPLAALPAGTVDIGRSILLVLTGCLGGPAYRTHSQASVCGSDYSRSTPTLEPVVVTLSRTVGFDKVGLQAVHAAQAAPSLDVRASGDRGAVSLVFASALGFGAIKPRPPDTRFSAAELGVDQADYGLQAVGPDGNVAYQETWTDILTAAGLAVPSPTRTYTAVLVGPDPRFLGKGWWNAPAFTLVDNDPTRP